MTAARFPNGMERRAASELRASPSGRRLEGYAAVFGSPTSVGGFSESIRAGAFAATLAEQRDVLAIVDHDPSRLLARRSSGTLRLAEDAIGLRFEIDVPDTTLGRDVLALAERRDLGGMSFGFRVRQGGERWPKPNVRELTDVELVEVSIVHAFPAYTSTTIQARGRYAGPAARMRTRWVATL